MKMIPVPKLVRFFRNNSSSAGAFGVLAAMSLALLPAAGQVVPQHYVVAANIDVVVTNFDNVNGVSVGVSTPYKIGDFRASNPNNGDYDVQIGDDRRDDVQGGALITSIREGSRVHQTWDGQMHMLYPGTNWATAHAAWADAGPTNGYWIPVAMAWPNYINTDVIEYDYNVAAAWFPYDKYLAGNAHYTDQLNMNNQALDEFWGSPGLALGVQFKDTGTAEYTVDLTSLGVDSRKDGILLATGAQNEDNYAAVYVNTNNGTWIVQDKDNGASPGLERDPVEFVFIPKTNDAIISGRFLANAAIDAWSGTTPRFTVSYVTTGTWELKFPGLLPSHGVLIITPEGGRTDNNDNIVFYEENAAKNGFLIYSRNTPGIQLTNLDNSIFNPLETPSDPTEPIVSFAFILGPTPGFTVTPAENLQTSEAGGTATFTVVLNVQPTANVTIGVSSSDTTEGTVSPASLTFTTDNWNVPQTVTVTGVDDALTDGPIDYSIVFAAATSADSTYNGLKPASISALNYDNEVGITVAPAAGLVTTEAGGTATFTVVLNTAPTANVVVGLTSSDTTEGVVSPASLTFTPANWSTKQTVTVTGVDDAVVDGNIAYSIITAAATSTDPNYNGRDPLDVDVTNTDNDVASITISTNALSIVEGQGATYTVTVGSQPTADVVVTVTSLNPTNGPTSPATLTFTVANWATPQTVNVSAVDNLVYAGNVSYWVSNTLASADALYAAIKPAAVKVTLLDNEAYVSIPAADGTLSVGAGAVYGSGMPAMLLAPLSVVTDPNVSSLNNATFTVAITANSSADDRLAIKHVGTDVDQIGVSGSTVSYGGVAIGTFAGGSGATPLVVTLNNAATAASVQALMCAVTFANVSSSPSTALRTVTYTLAHADGGVSSATTTVRVGLLHVCEFQNGVDRGYGIYTNAYDTHIAAGTEYSTAYSTGDQGISGNGAIWMDASTAGTLDGGEALLCFGNIVGTLPGQIPTNATIVYAQLVLTMPPTSVIANSPGDGSPLFRMLVPWDPAYTTFANAGNGDLMGFQPDGVYVRTNYDSWIGLSNGDADTGVGRLTFGVTPDVAAWVNGGEANYGWLMPGWLPPYSGTAPRVDGTAFACCEWTNNILDRPMLRVYWLPKDTAAASYCQGVNGYTNAMDTCLRRAYADTNYSATTGVFSDWAVTGSTNNDEQPLVQFRNVVGSDAGQIPMYSRIEAAVLALPGSIGNAMGDGGKIYAMLKPWVDSDTWNTLVNGVSADGVEAASTPTAVAGFAALSPNVQATMNEFDVTMDVQAWAMGTRPDYGWVILPWLNGGDGWGFGTAEQALAMNRPQLRVYYTPGAMPVAATLQLPVVSPTSVQVKFTGKVSSSYTVQRATALTGSWSSLGDVTTDGTGLGTYTDNAPPAGGAFYRVLSN